MERKKRRNTGSLIKHWLPYQKLCLIEPVLRMLVDISAPSGVYVPSRFFFLFVCVLLKGSAFNYIRTYYTLVLHTQRSLPSYVRRDTSTARPCLPRTDLVLKFRFSFEKNIFISFYVAQVYTVV